MIILLSPIITTVRREDTIRIAYDSNVLKQRTQIRIKCQTSKNSLIRYHKKSETQNGQNAYFTTIDQRYAHSQLQLQNDTFEQRNLNIDCGEWTGILCLKTGFYSLACLVAQF